MQIFVALFKNDEGCGWIWVNFENGSVMIIVDDATKLQAVYQQTLLTKMSYRKSICNPLDNYEQYSKSSSKRLFDAVFRILDHDELEISSFDQVETNGSKVDKFLNNQLFIQAVTDKIKLEQLDQLYPILKVQCKDKKSNLFTLDIDDLTAVFQKFSNLYLVVHHPSQLTYYIFFTSFTSAYVSLKLLNNFSIRHSLATLSVEWCPSDDYNIFGHLLPEYHSKVQWDASEKLTRKDSNNSNSQISKQNKLTCRYDIQIENQKDFQVARRIIGSKGTNMKKIIESSLDQAQDKSAANSNELLKLRLRGRGSGYKEGPEQLESEEQLHLCISAKDQSVYNFACQNVERLLQSVYAQYQEYTKKQGRLISLCIKKSDLSTQMPVPLSNNENVMKNIEVAKNGRMEAEKIQHFLELRNKARRQLNFAEADRIRNYLRACGVCLIDEKGRRGKATEVTTWKYLL